MKHQSQNIIGWFLLGFVVSHCVIVTIALPQQFSPSTQQQQRFGQIKDSTRKFAEKPNTLKKVALDDIDEDIQTNQISDNGFSWSNMIGTPLQ